MIETAWRHGKSESKITRLLPPEGENFQYKIKVPLSRTRGWPRKVSSIAPDDQRLSIMTFDYAASAELFMPKRKLGARQAVSYRRFTTAAEAIRFAVEEFPAMRSLGAWMRVGDDRFDSDDIQRLYESDCYPRRRRKRKSS